MRPFIKYKIKKILLPSFLFFLMLYFLYHLVQGHYGLIAWKRLKSHNESLTNKIEKLERKNSNLQDTVNRLKPQQLDLDYVEELVREKVGVYHTNDLIVHQEDLS